MNKYVGIAIASLVLSHEDLLLSVIVMLATMLWLFMRSFYLGWKQGCYLATIKAREGSPSASLEDDYNVDLDRDWMGAATARAETFILSGVFQERK